MHNVKKTSENCVRILNTISFEDYHFFFFFFRDVIFPSSLRSSVYSRSIVIFIKESRHSSGFFVFFFVSIHKKLLKTFSSIYYNIRTHPRVRACNNIIIKTNRYVFTSYRNCPCQNKTTEIRPDARILDYIAVNSQNVHFNFLIRLEICFFSSFYHLAYRMILRVFISVIKDTVGDFLRFSLIFYSLTRAVRYIAAV